MYNQATLTQCNCSKWTPSWRGNPVNVYARMVAAKLMWIAESERLREPLEYCQLFGEIVRIFKSIIVSVLYGSSIWKVTTSITTKLQAFVNRFLRSIFHINFKDYMLYWVDAKKAHSAGRASGGCLNMVLKAKFGSKIVNFLPRYINCTNWSIDFMNWIVS